jgi:hypothetical protein
MQTISSSLLSLRGLVYETNVNTPPRLLRGENEIMLMAGSISSEPLSIFKAAESLEALGDWPFMSLHPNVSPFDTSSPSYYSMFQS